MSILWCVVDEIIRKLYYLSVIHLSISIYPINVCIQAACTHKVLLVAYRWHPDY